MVRALHATALLAILVAARTGDAAQCGDTEFRCNSGECIPILDKCNAKHDCGDGSDELSCNASTTLMDVGDVLTANVQFRTELVAIAFLMCDDRVCSTIWTSYASLPTNGSLGYKSSTGCNKLGWSCRSTVGTWGGQIFSKSDMVFEVERRASELAAWLQGHPDKAVTVSVSEGQNQLRIRPYHWKSDLSVRISDWRRWRRWTISDGIVKETTVCLNGGQARHGVCSCPPGFSGSTCEQACGPDRHGETCSGRCSQTAKGCSGMRFCRWDASCTCAAGYHGEHCNEVCGRGSYGANCTQQCGHCDGTGDCDSYTGQCLHGCLAGYHGPTCHQKLTHLVTGPSVKSVTRRSVQGVVVINKAGSGNVTYLVVQHRETSGGDWIPGRIVPLNGSESEVPFEVDGLRADTEVALRALLLDEKLDALHSVPQTVVRTQGPRFLKDVVAKETEGSLRVSWTLGATKHLVFVEYKCVSVAGCNKDCSSSAGRVQAAGSIVLLEGLLPGAEYSVTVRTDDEAIIISTRTEPKVPQVKVSMPRVLAVSNTSAIVQWGPPEDCLLQGGPVAYYRWQLEPSGWGGGAILSGDTAATVLPLAELQPGQQYRLRVGVASVVGVAAAEYWSATNVSIVHSAPSAPLELTAYQWNRTALWLRWRPPALPGGTLLYYSVRAGGGAGGQDVQQQVPAATRCAAWTDEVCSTVRVSASTSSHRITVTATNDKTPQAGDEATAIVLNTEGVPEPVGQLEAVQATPTSVLLRWGLPRLLNGNLRYFQVTTTGGLSEEAKDDIEMTKEERPFYEKLVKGLQPGASYNVTVWCHGSGGHGTPASIIVTTPTEDKNAIEDESMVS